jgi:hypothetical protein
MGQTVTFNSAGVAPVTLAADVEHVQHQLGTIYEVPNLGVQYVEAAAGNATTTITVPTGKYWLLVGVFTQLVADANAADRIVTIVTQDTANAEIEEITHEIVTANNTGKRTTLFTTDDFLVGNEGVASQATLVIAEAVIAADDMTINGEVLTFVAALTGPGQILIGGSEAATKLALNAALVDRDNGGTLHSVSDVSYAAMECTAIDFASDDMVLTANVKGTAGDDITTAETFDGSTNVFNEAFGSTTAGVDQADKISSLVFPASGTVLDPGEDIVITVTDGVAGDDLDLAVFYLEYDSNPTT